jgi:hypothetical protein
VVDQLGVTFAIILLATPIAINPDTACRYTSKYLHPAPDPTSVLPLFYHILRTATRSFKLARPILRRQTDEPRQSLQFNGQSPSPRSGLPPLPPTRRLKKDVTGCALQVQALSYSLHATSWSAYSHTPSVGAAGTLKLLAWSGLTLLLPLWRVLLRGCICNCKEAYSTAGLTV